MGDSSSSSMSVRSCLDKVGLPPVPGARVWEFAPTSEVQWLSSVVGSRYWLAIEGG